MISLQSTSCSFLWYTRAIEYLIGFYGQWTVGNEHCLLKLSSHKIRKFQLLLKISPFYYLFVNDELSWLVVMATSIPQFFILICIYQYTILVHNTSTQYQNTIPEHNTISSGFSRNSAVNAPEFFDKSWTNNSLVVHALYSMIFVTFIWIFNDNIYMKC